jgi:hypothetical protein
MASRPRNGLVEDHDLRVVDHGPGKLGATLHPARELRRIFARKVLQADFREQELRELEGLGVTSPARAGP